VRTAHQRTRHRRFSRAQQRSPEDDAYTTALYPPRHAARRNIFSFDVARAAHDAHFVCAHTPARPCLLPPDVADAIAEDANHIREQQAIRQRFE